MERTHKARLLSRRWLSFRTFEIEVARPDGFRFVPGQYLRFISGEIRRDYSLITSPDAPSLGLCIRKIGEGTFSAHLADAAVGAEVRFTGPHGYFTHHPSPRPAVFAATGTGVAPFVSMARSGISAFTLLHGVRTDRELYYQKRLRAAAAAYIPCLSDAEPDAARQAGGFAGRVTEYIERRLPAGAYDFYLCGRREMIRDATLAVDDRFPDSRVYTEVFY